MDVVTTEEFTPIKAQLAACERDIAFLKSLLTGQQWISCEQTLVALDISRPTLWKLTKQGHLTFRHQGRKIQYDVFSIRNYLSGKKIEAWSIDQRVLKAITHS